MISSSLENKITNSLKKIKLFVFDVDGIFTDGSLVFSNNNIQSKIFNVKDGLGLLLIQKIGVKVAIVTGKKSDIVKNRFLSLGVKDIFQKQINKIKVFEKIKNKYNLSKSEIACMGDDLPDLALVKLSGFSAAPFDAVPAIKDAVNYVCFNNGGAGCVREICDLLIESKGLKDKIIGDYYNYGEVII